MARGKIYLIMLANIEVGTKADRLLAGKNRMKLNREEKRFHSLNLPHRLVLVEIVMCSVHMHVIVNHSLIIPKISN